MQNFKIPSNFHFKLLKFKLSIPESSTIHMFNTRRHQDPSNMSQVPGISDLQNQLEAR